MDDLSRLLNEFFDYSMTDVHTAFPGVVVKYDAATRRADIQPSIKRKMPDGSFLELPIIPEAPVLFFGTKKYTVHIPLEKDDEVLIIATERALDAWKSKGGKGIEEKDTRRFELMDCIAIPGLQPVDFIPVSEAGLNIVHKTKPDGDLISQVTMDDDKIKMHYKEKCVIEMSSDLLTADNGKVSVKLNGDKAAVKGADVELNGKVKSTGGSFECGGVVSPSGQGALCGVPFCLFTGAPQTGIKSEGT